METKICCREREVRDEAEGQFSAPTATSELASTRAQHAAVPQQHPPLQKQWEDSLKPAKILVLQACSVTRELREGYNNVVILSSLLSYLTRSLGPSMARLQVSPAQNEQYV